MSRFAPWVLSSVDHGTQLLCTVGCAVSWRVSPCSGSFFKGFDGMGPLKTHIMSHPPGVSLIPEALLCAHCPPAPTYLDPMQKSPGVGPSIAFRRPGSLCGLCPSRPLLETLGEDPRLGQCGCIGPQITPLSWSLFTRLSSDPHPGLVAQRAKGIRMRRNSLKVAQLSSQRDTHLRSLLD